MANQNLPLYSRCKHYVPTFEPGKRYCAPNAQTLGEKWEQKQEIDISACDNCPLFRSRYIEYPLTIGGIEVQQPEPDHLSFEPVRVRRCADDRTYFGILLGDFPWMTHVAFDEQEQKLRLSTVNNPLIYIPQLNEVVFGAESWWQRLSPGEEVSAISDDAINNTWYVQLLRAMIIKEE